MNPQFLRLGAPWQGPAAVDPSHTAGVERTLSNVRVVLIAVSLVAAALERSGVHGLAALSVLTALTIYSIAVAILLRLRPVRSARQVVALHLVDSGGTIVVTLLTGGAVSPFSTLMLFAMLAAGYRWGQRETWLTTLAAVLGLVAQAVIARLFGWTHVAPWDVVALRTVYLGAGGLLLAYMSESERRHRYRAWAVSRIMSRVRGEGGLVATVQAVMDELLTQFRATNAVLVLEEEGHERVSVWHAWRDAAHHRPTIRLDQRRRDACSTYLFPVPPDVEALQVTRDVAGPDAERTTVLLAADGTRVQPHPSAAPLLDTPFPWRTAFCLSSINGEGWSGRLFLFMQSVPPAARQQLRFLQLVVRQVAPALFNLYLQRRLQSRAGVVERARISRELHDGVIQALIGVEMQLEVLRREAGAKLPESTAAQLLNVQRILSQEILDVRDLMQLLKPAEVDAKRIVEHLADTVERFRHRTGIQARLACEVDEIDVSPRICREIAAVVQEALANVRKHSNATSVLVRLGPVNGSWELVVDDNGRGLDFEGYLAHEEIEARRKGPVIIRERVHAIGGRLGIYSQPGFGTRLEITIPRKHHG